MAQIGDLLLALAGIVASRPAAAAPRRSGRDSAAGHRPEVALVLRQRHGRRRRRFCVSPSISLDAAEQCRRVGKARGLGQEAPHLDLGIECRPQACDTSARHSRCRPARLNQDRSASIARICSGCRIGRWAKRLVGRNSSRNPCSPSSTVSCSRRFTQQQADEDRVGGDVEQRAFARALAHGGQCLCVVALAVEAHPFDLHRHAHSAW